MKWIKATERLPQQAGENNKVIIRGKDFLTYGYRTFNDTEPQICYELNGKTYLTLNVEWLDECKNNKDSYSGWNEFKDYIVDLYNKIRNKPTINIETKFQHGDLVLIIDDSEIKLMKIKRVIFKGRKNPIISYMFQYPSGAIIYRNEDKCYRDMTELFTYYNEAVNKEININNK